MRKKNGNRSSTKLGDDPHGYRIELIGEQAGRLPL